MQVTETLNEGLKRKLSLVIPKSDLTSRLETRLGELRNQANIKGFRPGKVPATHLKKMYGKSAMAEVMQDAINATVGNALTELASQLSYGGTFTLPAVTLPTAGTNTYTIVVDPNGKATTTATIWVTSQ